MESEDYEPFDLISDEFEDVIIRDEKETFISEISWNIERYEGHSDEIFNKLLLHSTIYCSVIKCAEALITGQTPLAVDVNLPCYGGMCPLHYILSRHCEQPSLVELLLCYGARTDVKYSGSNYGYGDSYDNVTPLQMALREPL